MHHGSRKPQVPISSRKNRLRQMEKVLVMERLAQRFAESAQQMVGTQSAGIEKSLGARSLVGAKETGEPPTSSGESGLSSQAEGMALHLYSLIFWSCLGAFEQMMIGLLRNVVAKKRDPAVADKVTMMGRKRRLPIQLYYVIALTCRRRVSLAVRRVFSFGFEAWTQLCREFEHWVSSRFQLKLQAPLPFTRTDSSVREIQRLPGDRTSENVEVAVLQRNLCDGELGHQSDLQSGSPTMMCDLARDEITEHVRAVPGVAERADLSPRGKGGGGKKSQDESKGVKTETEGMLLLRDVQSWQECTQEPLSCSETEVRPTWQNKSARQCRGGLRVRQETVLKRDEHGEACTQTGCLFPPWR